jgi:cryptochrome
LFYIKKDWSLNNANWQWLSCSNFFYQYFRCYSPIAFGKKTDPTGAYIRKWIPVLKKIPDKYIFEPWKAPKEIQKSSGCIIGVDYPNPIVEHDKVSKINMDRMKNAYDLNGSSSSSSSSSSSDLNKTKEPAASSLSTKRKIDSYLVPKSKK